MAHALLILRPSRRALDGTLSSLCLGLFATTHPLHAPPWCSYNTTAASCSIALSTNSSSPRTAFDSHGRQIDEVLRLNLARFDTIVSENQQPLRVSISPLQAASICIQQHVPAQAMLQSSSTASQEGTRLAIVPPCTTAGHTMITLPLPQTITSSIKLYQRSHSQPLAAFHSLRSHLYCRIAPSAALVGVHTRSHHNVAASAVIAGAHACCFHNAAASVAPVIEHAPEAMIYKVEVFTGDRRGAGSPMPAVLRLVGSAGSSDGFVLGGDDQVEGTRPGFRRGACQTYLLSIDVDLGDILRMEVEQVSSSMSELGTGWFLDRVDLTLPSGERLAFPCGHWIGKSDETSVAAPRQRNLIPCCLLRRPSLSLTGHPISVSASAMAVPHPEKVAAGTRAVNRRGVGHGGEDAYFYAQNENGVFALAVADGIYSWKTQGIDSGIFARQLMSEVHHLFKVGYTDVLTILQDAERRLRIAGTQGSSTVCVVLMDLQQGRLTSANLGDSGFLVLGSTPSDRHLHVKYRSPQQEHEFGYPFQLGHHEHTDTANDAVLTTLPVLPGDIVVLGTDGLFDNVSDGELVTITQQLLRENCCTPSELARCLLHNAYHNSNDRQKTTPYSEAATETFDMVYSGGKKDDITVVVAKVVDAQSSISAASAAASLTTGTDRGSDRR